MFRAWTIAEELEMWFSPSLKNRVEATVDLRVGGRYQIAMIPPEGDAWIVGGEYRVIEPPEELQFTWKWSTDPTEGFGTLVTVLFHETDEGSEIELIHSGLESQESHDNHGQGWTLCMNRLGEYLASRSI